MRGIVDQHDTVLSWVAAGDYVVITPDVDTYIERLASGTVPSRVFASATKSGNYVRRAHLSFPSVGLTGGRAATLPVPLPVGAGALGDWGYWKSPSWRPCFRRGGSRPPYRLSPS